MENNILQNWSCVQSDSDSREILKGSVRLIIAMLYVTTARTFVIKAQQKQFYKCLWKEEGSLRAQSGSRKRKGRMGR